MLVRQQSKQIAISRQGKILSVVQGAHEYAVRRKVYNFNQISNHDQDRECPALTESRTNIGKENEVMKRREQVGRFGDEESEVGGMQMYAKNANLKRKNPRKDDDNGKVKEESHVLLKIVATVLAILSILTIIQTISPNSLEPLFSTLNTIKSFFPSNPTPNPNDL